MADGGEEFLAGTQYLEDSGQLSCNRLLTPIPGPFLHEYHFMMIMLWTLLFQMSLGEQFEARSAGAVLKWGKSVSEKEKDD